MKLLDAIKKAKALLSSVKLSQEPLEDGSLIQYDGDMVTVGEPVYLVDAAGNTSVLPDGEYVAKTGLKFVVKDGVVESIDKTNYKEPEKEEEPKQQAQQQSSQKVKAEEIPSGTTETPEDEVEEEAKPEDVASTAFTLEAIGHIIDKKLLPVWDAINAIQNCIVSYPALYKSHKETLDAVEQIAESVTKLSKEPAAGSIEKQVNPFKKVPAELKESRAYKILHS